MDGDVIEVRIFDTHFGTELTVTVRPRGSKHTGVMGHDGCGEVSTRLRVVNIALFVVTESKILTGLQVLLLTAS